MASRVVYIFGVFGICAYGITVPGENVDKKTLNSLGIKTIGWQNSETTSEAPNVNIYHNYSKISLQNENVESRAEYSQLQPSYTKSKEAQTGVKGPRLLSENIISSSQYKNAEKNGGYDRGKPTAKSEFTQQTSLNYLELSQIVEAEKHNQDWDQETSASNYDHQQSPPQFGNTLPDPKSFLYKNKAGSENIMVAYSKCPEGATGQFVHSGSCQQFLNCWKGRGAVQNCGPGTHFNPKTLECDFAFKVQCLTGPSSYRSEKYQDSAYIREKGVECPPEFSGVVPHKSDCSKFINCAYGVQNVMNCPPGTLFSLKINSCDFPYNAECAEWSVEFGNNNVNYDAQGSNINKVYEGSPSSGGSYNGDYLQTGSSQWSSNTLGENNYQSGIKTSSSWKNPQQENQSQTGYYQGSSNGLNVNSGWENKKQTSSGQIGSSAWGQTQQSLPNGQNNYYQVSGSGSYDKTDNDWKNTEQTVVGQNQLNKGQNTYYQGSGSNINGAWENRQNGQNTGSGWTQSLDQSGYQVSKSTQSGYGQNQNYKGSSTNTHYTEEHYTGSESKIQTGNYGIQNKQAIVNRNNYGVDQTTPRCPQGAVGLFPHPTICAKFLNCANGQTFIQDCGPGTVFNPQTTVCDFPYNVDCSDFANVIDVRSESKFHGGSTPTHSQYEHKDLDVGASSNVYDKYEEPKVDENDVVKCPPRAVGFYPHPVVCSMYYTCASGKPTIYKCATGMVFNPLSKVCDLPYKVKCATGLNEVDFNTNTHQKPDDKQTQGFWDQNQQGFYDQNVQNNFDYDKKHTTTNGKTNLNDNKQNQGTWDQNQQGSFDQNVQDNFDYDKKHTTTNGKTPNDNKQNQGTWDQNQQGSFDQDQFDYDKKHTTTNGKTNLDDNKQGQGSWDQTQQGSSNQNTYGNKDSSPGKISVTHGDNANPDENKEANTEKPVTPNSNGSLKPSKFKDVCAEEDFYCGIDMCLPQSMVCDGTKDCPNGIDELGCGKIIDRFAKRENSVLAIRERERYSNLSIMECAKSCLDSKGFDCKSFSYRSDAECFLSDSNIGLCGSLIDATPYNYYELRSGTLDCTTMHQCPNNKCINHTQICDGVNDCGDRSDEKGCGTKSFGYEIRLAGTANKHEGRIELKAFGKWGYICDDRFGMRDADVVCHELGFPLGALEIKGNSYYAKEIDLNDVLFLMDDVVCLGNETSIRDCDFNGWGVSNCEPQEIVGVVCKTPIEKCPKDQFKCDTVQECVPLPFVCDNVFDCTDQSDEATQHCDASSEIRLVNGGTEREGRVEIRHHGIWGTICDDDFNDDAAKVVCNSLGFPGKASVKKDGYFGEGEGPIWLDQVFCQGNETLLQECTHWNWGEHNCEHAEDVGVVCSGSKVVETDSKSNTESSLNLVEVPPEEIFPSECGLRKNSLAYIDEVNFRVVQGSIAKRGFYPWQASLRIRNTAKPTPWCGAVVISRRFVLTAAHCLFGFSKGSYVVVAGDYNTDDEEGTEQEVYVEDFYIHEEFRSGQKMNNDIALVKLKGKGFTFTKDIQPICLPETNLAYTNQLNCTISGFGSVQTGVSGYSHDLRAGWVPIQLPDVCKMPHVYGNAITDGMFCAGSLDEGVDSCEGDSGGPLACLHNGVFTLYGITSWGKHCGHANKPGVYVKVSYYRDWIENTIRKNV